MIRPEQMPYRNAMGKTYDTGQFERVLDQGLALADWNGFDARAADAQARGRLRGRGIATFVEWTGADVFEERVTVTVERRRRDRDLLGDAGDGHVAGDDVRAARRRRVRRADRAASASSFGDTDRGTGFGSAGSRSLFVGGSAVHVASERTVKKAHELAAEELEAARRRHRVSRRRVPHRRHRSRDRPVRARGEAAGAAHRARLDELGRPTRRGRTAATSAKSRSTRTPATVEVADYWSVNDVGRVVNPMVVVGPARRRRRAGHRAGAVRAGRLRPRVRPAADRRRSSTTRCRAPTHGPPFRDDDRRVDAVDRTTTSA